MLHSESGRQPSRLLAPSFPLGGRALVVLPGDLVTITSAVRGEIRLIHGLRVASSLISLVGLLVIVNGVFVQSAGSAVAARVVGGLVLIAGALAVRRMAERRAAVVNERARMLVSDAYGRSCAAPRHDLVVTLLAMAPGPADDRFVRRHKERDTVAFVRTLETTDAIEAAGALARMIDADSLVTPKEQERLLRLQVGPASDGDQSLAGLDANDILTLATMAADPCRSAHDRH